MAYSKPSILGWMLKGVFVGAINGFTDTYNWIVSCWNNIQSECGISITNTENGMPKIGLKIVAGDGIKTEEYNDALKISADYSGITPSSSGLRFFNYDADTQTIGYGIVYVGNKGVYVSPLSNVSTGDYRVKVTINGFGATASHTAAIEAGSYTETPSDDNVVYIGLYTVTDSGITNDYRCEPYIIQAWS